MKSFLMKFGLFVLLLGAVYFYYVDQLSQGFVDDYYGKFTGKSGSLILGVSRAHDGLVPSILEEELELQESAKPLFNFAFEKTQSPYGEVYLEAVKKKLKDSDGQGVFILSVTPGTFTVKKGVDEDEILELDRETMMLYEVKDPSADPNYDYIINYYPDALYTVYTSKSKEKSVHYYHEDGWDEFRTEIPGYTVSKEQMEEWTLKTIEAGKNLIREERISDYRLHWLEETIRYLQGRGEVYLVRLPIDTRFIYIEDDYWPKFNTIMEGLGAKYGIPYFNYVQPKYQFETFDGSHMTSKGAQEFTRLFARELKAFRSKS